MSEEGSPRIGVACLSTTTSASKSSKEEELARECERNIQSDKKRRVGHGGRWTAAATAASESAAGSPPLLSEEAGARDDISAQSEGRNHPGMEGEEKGGAVQGWAKPGLGVCQLWARQASSLKRKKSVAAAAAGDTCPPSASASASSPTLSSPSAASSSSTSGSGLTKGTASVAVGFGVDDPVPASREEKAKLVGGYLGTSRPGYGNEAMKRDWWPVEVPWLKGMSISQMNNATLHTLVVAVKAHQRKARHQALASGAEKLPDGLLVCAPKTKKEMSRLIRSIQGRRLQYGKTGKCPAWWPIASAPWDSERPLSTMKHGEVTSIFKAMVREGLLSEADSAASCSSPPPAPTVAPGSRHGGDNDRGETTSEERSDRHSSGGSSSGGGGGSNGGGSSGGDGNSGRAGGGGGGTAPRPRRSGSTAGRDGRGSGRRAGASIGSALYGGGGGREWGRPASSGVDGCGPLAASHLTFYGNVNNSRPPAVAGVPLPRHRAAGQCGSMQMPTPMSPSLARPISLLAVPGQHHRLAAQSAFLQPLLHWQRDHHTHKQLRQGHLPTHRAGASLAVPPSGAPSASPSQARPGSVSPAPLVLPFSAKSAGAPPPRFDELTATWQDQLGLFDNGGGGGGLFGLGGGGLNGATTAANTAVTPPAAGFLFSHGQPAWPPGGANGASGPGGRTHGSGSFVGEGCDDHPFASAGDVVALDPLM